MNGLEAVSAAAGTQTDSAAKAVGQLGEATPDAAQLQAVHMLPPGTVQGGVSFGDKLWSGIDNLSVRMKEVQESLKTAVAESARMPEATGDMVVDMRNTMFEMQNQNSKLLVMQMKINESGSVFAIGLGMIQSAQHSAKTLLQDK